MLRTVLVFAASRASDLQRRALPSSASRLLNCEATARDCRDFADVHWFGRAPVDVSPERVHRQVGRSFGERLERAVATLVAQGYEQVVVIGQDCPGLCVADVRLAFDRLQTGEVVLGPDHRGGCYLIGVRAGAARRILAGMRWNRDRDCAEIMARSGAGAVSLLAVKQDVDSWRDLRFLARLADSFGRLAAFLIGGITSPARASVTLFDAAAHLVRVRGQRPPPLAIS